MLDINSQKEGGIFFIPLFLPDDIKNNRKSYRSYKFDQKMKYAYGRLIEIDKSSGDLIEVFRFTGSIPNKSDVLIKSGLLFPPLHVAMGFERKRWRFLFESNEYDKIIDSNYSNISFLLGDYQSPKLWQGGKELGSIDVEKANNYNHWIVYAPTQLETKIREVNKIR